jgi:hypothetical protein
VECFCAANDVEGGATEGGSEGEGFRYGPCDEAVFGDVEWVGGSTQGSVARGEDDGVAAGEALAEVESGSAAADEDGVVCGEPVYGVHESVGKVKVWYHAVDCHDAVEFNGSNQAYAEVSTRGSFFSQGARGGIVGVLMMVHKSVQVGAQRKRVQVERMVRLLWRRAVWCLSRLWRQMAPCC